MKMAVLGISAIILVSSSFVACNYFAYADGSKANAYVPSVKRVITETPVDSSQVTFATDLPQVILSETEASIINYGLVDIQTIDSNIVVELKYSTLDNFIGVDVYGDFNKCYLQPDVAEKLRCAQELLRSRFPYYNLIVYDAARPRSIQTIMWDTINVPYYEKSKYLSDPKGGSLHNFGAAVDLSIIDKDGYVLDMGTPYDYFGELAYPREEDRMIYEGKLSYKQLLSRELLREVMEQSGFSGITTEWWHFNSCSRKRAYQQYAIIE
ncbi:MAG: M15 family metallopeptidase [Bacteroidota bacterium]